jgi:hypothetical protein
MVRGRTRGRDCVRVAALWLLAFRLLLPVAAPTVSAQPGASLTTPALAPTPRPSSAGAAGLRSEPAAGDTYKLVFPTEYERKSSYKLDKRNDREIFGRDREAEINGFIDELNKFGGQNYRVGFLLDGDLPVAVLESVDKRYEYAWFETDSYLGKALDGPGDKYSALSEKGFHLFEHDLFTVYCERANEVCNSYDNFFLERENGDDTPVRHRLISKGRVQVWHEAKLTREILEQVNDGLRDGLYPAQALDPYDILLESRANGDKPSTDRQDLQIARDTSIWGADTADNLPKNVNKLAAQGYRLTTVGYGMALMTRPAGAAAPVSYVWVNAGKKDFEQEVARLQARGAIFRTAYPNADGTMQQLIFELPSAGGGARREYKVLKFTLYVGERAANGRSRLRIDFSSDSKDAEKKLNDLAREGFVVRGLFISDEYCILLERSR